jgi:hypothetical protein
LKTQVFVLVPLSVPPSALLGAADRMVERNRMGESGRLGEGRFDYLVGAGGCFDDPVAEGRLPGPAKRSLRRCVTEVERLPADLVPGAVVTPDGRWHDLADEGWHMLEEPSAANEEALARWRARCRKLLAENPYCWVVEFNAHS